MYCSTNKIPGPEMTSRSCYPNGLDLDTWAPRETADAGAQASGLERYDRTASALKLDRLQATSYKIL